MFIPEPASTKSSTLNPHFREMKKIMWLEGLHIHAASAPENSPQSAGNAMKQSKRNNLQAVSLDLPALLHLVGTAQQKTYISFFAVR